MLHTKAYQGKEENLGRGRKEQDFYDFVIKDDLPHARVIYIVQTPTMNPILLWSTKSSFHCP